MDEINYDAEFAKLTGGLDIPDPEVAISLFDIAHTMEAIHEACAFLSEYIKIQLSLPEGVQLEFPDELVPIIPHFRRTAEIISDELHSMFHVECDECEECEAGEDPEEGLI